MKLHLEPGVYVAAVSGGVDSMALLDLLRTIPHVQIIVAHFDHGIRNDSAKDRILVQETAKRYHLPFVYKKANLGINTSEEVARKNRYDFLYSVKNNRQADKIITAHHRDDVLETAIHNLLRGSGRRGMTSLRNTDDISRPLLGFTKNQILDYARQNSVKWREDSTNSDLRYRRNYIRRTIINHFTEIQKNQLMQTINEMVPINDEIDAILSRLIDTQSDGVYINRQWFVMLPHNIALETMASWLRKNGVRDISTNMLERLVIASKTYKANRRTDVNKSYVLFVHDKYLALECQQR